MWPSGVRSREQSDADRASVTLFSSAEFVRALASAPGAQGEVMAIPVRGSGAPRTMYALRTPLPHRCWYVELAPYCLNASPGWNGPLEPATIKSVLKRLQGVRIRQFLWNVRFDHEPLASGLMALGLKPERVSTHVLYLDRPYEETVSRYSATTRNHVRKAQRRGLRVREARSREDVHAYYDVHLRLVDLKRQTGRYGWVYPVELLLDLWNLHDTTRLLLAEWEGRVIGGGLFVRDGCSIYYFHGASDRDYSHLYPLSAVLDEAIRWAYEIGATFFNLTAAGGIATLDRFKASWGTRYEFNWTFRWSNPLWERLSRLKEIVTRG